ncbi:DMT family transporter [Pseudonocardia petroleophila]|uniref:DMT family transporter n=1 Tax=Pseudonocardia petroleophila TaxID=37331 RepID=UPI0021049660|nr:DMT family transporter [Pseudonocardia petroleophila]
MVSVVLAVLAAAASAVAAVLQRKAASTESRRRAAGPGLLLDLACKPVWLGGVAAIVVGFGLHAAALATGPIILVQPILVLELGFALLFAAAVFHSRLHTREWTAIAGMTVGLALLLFSLHPSGGDPGTASAAAWAVGIAITLAVAGLFGWRAHRSPDSPRTTARRPAYLGIATGLGFGLTATLVAAVSSALTDRGITGVLTTWQTYLLVVLGPLVFFSLQRTLQAGRLVVSQPAITLTNPVVAFGFGVGIFGEDVRTGAWLIGALAGFALVAGCTVALARSPLLHDAPVARADRGGPPSV